ncbi:MAG: biopolymer transporter ExbD [Polyangiaceae bacterium]|nr:biopolymer transporter ExbD [Polyangiaceae bacterium]
MRSALVHRRRSWPRGHAFAVAIALFGVIGCDKEPSKPCVCAEASASCPKPGPATATAVASTTATAAERDSEREKEPDSIPLPEGGPPGAASAGTLTIDVPKDGPPVVDGKQLKSTNDLVRIAKAAHDKDPGVRATIRADASTTHAAVMQVIDLLKQGGVTKVAFGVNKVGSSSNP